MDDRGEIEQDNSSLAESAGGLTLLVLKQLQEESATHGDVLQV